MLHQRRGEDLLNLGTHEVLGSLGENFSAPYFFCAGSGDLGV